MTVRRSSVSLALGALAAGTLALPVHADPFETLERLDQAQFLELAETLGAATHYKAVTPAEPLGIIGFDIGIELSSTSIDGALFDLASDGDYGTGSLLLPRLHVHKGLPFGIDIGAFLGTIPSSDLTLIGGEVRIALVEGGVAVPAVGLRASYARGQGSDELDLDSAALELTVSKGFLMLTPLRRGRIRAQQRHAVPHGHARRGVVRSGEAVRRAERQLRRRQRDRRGRPDGRSQHALREARLPLLMDVERRADDGSRDGTGEPGDGAEGVSGGERRGTGLLAVAGSVGAAMIGVQSRKNRERDFTHGKPLHFVVGGLIGTAVFLLVVWLLVQYVIATS